MLPALIPHRPVGLCGLQSSLAPATPVAAHHQLNYELLSHVRSVFVTRELLRALLHLPPTASDLARVAASAAAKASEKVGRLKKGSERRLQPAEVLAMHSVCKTVHSIAHQHPGSVTRQGQQAVLQLKCAVYGEDAADKNVLELVAFFSMTRASILQQACLSVLKELACGTNCFTLLALGEATGCKDLHERALLQAAPNFAAAAKKDRVGFLGLKQECLQQVLQSEQLKASASDVLRALVRWVRQDATTRFCFLNECLEDGTVQLSRVSSSVLQKLSWEPMVQEDPAVAALVQQELQQRSPPASSSKAARSASPEEEQGQEQQLGKKPRLADSQEP